MTPPILLDVTRLVTRIGRGRPTGIDRAVGAWLGLVSRNPQNRLLFRTRRGQLVLAAEHGGMILRWMGLAPDGRIEAATATPPAPDLRAHLAGRIRSIPPVRAAAEAHLARLSLARAARDGRGMGHALQKAGMGEGVYLNLGHGNLAGSVLASIPLRRVILIHDVIPLDYPEWTRPQQVTVFQRNFEAAARHADALISITQASCDRLVHWRRKLGLPETAPVVAALLGTGLATPDPAQPIPDRPYFITLGTIEPRKNHALLLDAWQRMVDPPLLLILGQRGWLNEDVFARLDQLGPDAPIREMTNLSDAAVAALMAGAQALLFPSRAEGFGLPLTEAAARGVPVLGLDLPTTQEILGDYAHYLPDDAQIWADAITALAAQNLPRKPPFPVPDWNAHFDTVMRVMTAKDR